jgi:hypothetical protein
VLGAGADDALGTVTAGGYIADDESSKRSEMNGFAGIAVFV